eukprot:7865330-Pyramimonas_sp.AAC.1
MQWYGFSPHVRHPLAFGAHHHRVWIVGPRRPQCSLRCRQSFSGASEYQLFRRLGGGGGGGCGCAGNSRLGYRSFLKPL